jgi:general secretion pathway protein D
VKSVAFYLNLKLSWRGSQMATSTNKSWNAVIVIIAFLLIGVLSSSAWTAQEPQDPDREKKMEEIRQRLMEAAKKSTAQPRTNQPKGQQPRDRLPVQVPAPVDPAAESLPVTPPPAPEAPAGSQAPESAPAPAPAAVQRDGGRVRLNYENADLYDFVNQIASTLGITPIVIDSDVKGTVNILSTAPMSRDDIFPLFSLILKNNNAALIQENGIYQIVPISSALKKGIEIIEKLPGSGPSATPGGKPTASQSNQPLNPLFKTFQELAAKQQPNQPPPALVQRSLSGSGTPRMATHVIRAEYVPVQDLIEPIRLFMTEGGVIMPYERLNMLILTDYTDSVERILEIVRMLDRSWLDPDLMDMIEIENNASADVADDLTKIFGTGAEDSATGISFTSIDRMNAIFVIASSRRSLEEVKRWIKQLDSESARNIQTYVYVVQNSTASNIAMMLSALYGGDESSGAAQGAGAGAQTAGGAFGSGSPEAGGNFGSSRSGFSNSAQTGSGGLFGSQGSMGANQSLGSGGFGSGMSGGGFFGTGQRLGPQLSVSPTVSTQILRGGELTGLKDTVRMVVDDINNSLIIQANAVDYAFISETIKKMDVMPRQVLIDARIFEVDLTNSLRFGVNAILQGRTDNPADHLTGGDINWESALDGLSANTFAFVGSSREILMRLNALRLKTNVRILEAPSVLALDGTPASIIVGAEIPYPTGSYTPSTGGSTTSVQYRETGISLLIMPRISASGAVTLNVTQEVSAPGAAVDFGTGENAPSFNLSRVMTTLSVKDGETVAIAGLIRDTQDFSRSGVPLLSDIPILGALFGQTNRGTTRTELIIMITPHVIRTPDAMEEMTQELRDSLRNVRQLADEKEREHIKDMEDAREERYKREQEIVKDRKKALSEKPE